MLLIKNPQFWPNHNETLSKKGTHGYLILTKFRYYWVKIVDFLIKAYVFQTCQICFVFKIEFFISVCQTNVFYVCHMEQEDFFNFLVIKIPIKDSGEKFVVWDQKLNLNQNSACVLSTFHWKTSTSMVLT